MKEMIAEKKAPRYGSKEYRKQHLLNNLEDAIDGTRDGKSLTAEQVQSLLEDFQRALVNAKGYVEKARTPMELTSALEWADAWHMADLHLRAMVRKGVEGP